MPRISFITLLFALVLLFPIPGMSFVNGGDVLWQFRDQRPGKQNPATSVIDSQGNTIVTGSRIVPGSGNYEEFYTIKVKNDGSLAWRAVFSKPGFNARATAVAVDAEDNVYVTGVHDSANRDVQLIRYDKNQGSTDAVAAWQKTFDGGGIDKATSLAVSGDYVYVGGSSRYGGNECVMVLQYNRADGAPGFQIPNATTNTIGMANAVATDGSVIAVVGQSWSGAHLYFNTISYDIAGNRLWAWQYALANPPDGYTANDNGLLVKVDSAGHVVASGSVDNGSNTDIYTAKFCSGSAAPCTGKSPGDILWQHTYAGESDDEPNSLQLDKTLATLDDVYVTGHSFLNGRNKMVTLRYHGAATSPQTAWPDGTAIFSSDGESHDIPAAMAVGEDNNSLYVVGYSEGLDWMDAFRAVKYRKSTGAEIWSRVFSTGANGNSRAIGVGLDANHQPFVAGYADETAPLAGETATTTGGSKSVLSNAAKGWSVNAWAGYYVHFTSGANAGQTRVIQSNTPTTLTFSLPLANDVLAGDAYYIYDQDDYDFYVVSYAEGILNPPTQLVANSASPTSIDLAWQDNNDTTPNFRVERCTNGSSHLLETPCDFDNPAQTTSFSVTGGATGTTVSGLEADRYYYFRVKAYSGPDSDYANATLLTYPTMIVHAVTQFVAAVAPGVTYTYGGVANNDDYALTIAASPVSGNPVVSGKGFFNPGGFDYYTLRLDKGNLTKLWSQRYDDPENQGDVAMCLAVDKNDQVIVSGYSMLWNFTAAKDMNSIFTIKYKADAASTPENDPDYYEWYHQYNGGSTDDRPIAISAAADSSNNIAVVGMGVHSSLQMSNHDIYLVHYPPNGPGNLPASPNPGYWTINPIEKGDDDEPTDVVIDAAGNVIITGFTKNTTRARKDFDIYTAKFAASNGALLWEMVYDGGYGNDEANSLAVDPAGNVYVTGFTITSDGTSDYVTIKYDAAGVEQWVKTHNGPAGGDDEAVGVKVDPLNGQIVVAGIQLTDAGNNDVHVIRYAPDGSLVWQRTLLREHNDEDMFDMAIDPSGNVSIAASTTNNANTGLEPENKLDILTFQLDWQGNFISNVFIYGSIEQLDKPYGIASNYQGDAFVAGIRKNTSDNADYVVLKIDGPTVQSPYPLNHTHPTYTSVKLDWTDSSKAEQGFQLARRTGACPTGDFVWDNGEIITSGPNHLAANTITFTDSGLTSKATYCYGVRAFQGTTYSRWANRTVALPVPPAPSSITAVAATTTKVTVSWTPQNNGQQAAFDLYRCSDNTAVPCTDFAVLAPDLGSAVTSYDDLSVCSNKIYRYMLKAKATGWESDFSVVAASMLPAANNMAVDSGLEAPDPDVVSWKYNVGGIDTGLSFDGATVHSGVKSLKIQASGVNAKIGRRQFVLVVPNGRYQLSAYFKTNLTTGAVACDVYEVGGGWTTSAIQQTGVKDWTLASAAITIPAAPASPGGRLRCYATENSMGDSYLDDVTLVPLYVLTATRYSETQIDLAWTDSAYEETGYSVERCIDAGCSSPQVVASLGANVTSYRDNRLAPDTTYWYRVRPYKTAAPYCGGGWNGDYSNTVSAVTTNNPVVLSGTAANTTTVNLSWSDPAGTENQFQIERCTAASCSMATIAAVLPNTTTYSDASVCSNTTYNYQVRAVDHQITLDGGTLWTRKVKLDFGATFRANFLTRLTINPLTGMDAGFKDIRFYDATAKQELPYWVESAASGSAIAWIKTGSADDIYLYFGNDKAIANSSFSSVFGAGAIGYWPFNEGVGTRSGTTYDSSGAGSNASFNTTIPSPYGVIAAGRYGNGFSLDGATTYAKVPDTTGSAFDFSGSHTIEFWYQYQPSEAWTRIISKPTRSGAQPWDLYSFQTDNTTNAQKVTYRIVSGNIWPNSNDWGSWVATREAGVSGPSMVPGSWYHYLGRYDYVTGKLSLFVNGVEYSATATPPIQIPPSDEPFTIGSRGPYGGYPKGVVDEVRIYNRALSDQEVAARYTATLPVVTAPVDAAVTTDLAGLGFSNSWNGPYSKPFAGSAAPAPSTVITPAMANLLADSDFENSSTPWTAAVETTTGTSFDATAAYSGTKSLKFAPTGSTLGRQQTVGVIPGASYTLSGWFKTAFTSGTAQCDVYGAGGIPDSAGIGQSGTGNWTYKTHTITIPNGVTSVSIRCFANGSPQGQAWLDMVQFVPDQPINMLTATAVSEEQVDLTWLFPAGRDQAGFKIERCNDAGCTAPLLISALNAQVATSTPGSWKYSDKGLPHNSSYWYRLRAYKNEDPACNGGKGYWETLATTIAGPAYTELKALTLGGTGAITTSCEDIRVTEADGTTQIPYYVADNDDPTSKCNTKNTKLIVKIPAIPTNGKSLYLYYGNLLAASKSSGTQVFDFFDDFDGTAIDTAKWDTTNATGFTVSNSQLHGANTSGRLVSVRNDWLNLAASLQVKVKPNSMTANGFMPAGYYYDAGSSIGWLHAPGGNWYRNNGNWTLDPAAKPSGSSAYDSFIFQVTHKSYWLNDFAVTDVQTTPVAYSPGFVDVNDNGGTPKKIALGRRYDDNVTYDNQVYSADWEWVRIRQWASPAPSSAAPGAVTTNSYTLAGETYPAWRFRRPVTISHTGGAVANFQVNIVTDTTAMGTERNTLTWTTTTATETGFTLERCKDSQANCTANFVAEKTFANLLPKNSAGAQVTYVDKDLVLNSPSAQLTYCYRVKALKSGGWTDVTPQGETPYSGVVCMTTKLQEAPANLQASANGTTINLTWTDKTTGETGFKLERCQEPCDLTVGPNTTIVTPPNDDKISTASSYADSNLCAGIYRYRISAYKDNPDGTAWTVGPVNLTGDTIATTLPPVPLNLVSSRINENKIRVTWKDMTPDETGFEVWRCEGSTTCVNFTKVPALATAVAGSGSTVTYDDTYGIVPGTTYRYKVRAYIIGACTAYSDYSADNNAAAPNGPDYATASVLAPSAASATSTSTTQVDLAWTDNVVSESFYSIDRCPLTIATGQTLTAASCSTPTASFSAAVNAVAYSDTSVCSDNLYKFSIYPIVHPALAFLSNSGNALWRSRSAFAFTDFQPNFITRVVITKGSDKDMQDDFRDIRFFDTVTQFELPYWIQSYSGTGSAATATVWFKTGANQAIDLYYGNSVATSSSSKDGVFGSGLLGFWPFDEAAKISGTLNDVSGSNNHLTMVGFDTLNSYGVVAGGRNGNMLKLDGSNDYAYRTAATLPTGSTLSAEAWIYSESPTYDYNGIVSWGARGTGCPPTNGNFASVAMSMGVTGYPQMPTWCNDYVPGSGLKIDPGGWTHYAFTMNGREIRVYINGAEQIGSLDVNKAVPIVTSQQLSVGALEAYPTNARFFKGMIDDLRVYSRVLSQADINARYRAVLPAVTVGARNSTGAVGTSAPAYAVAKSPANLLLNNDFESDRASWGRWPDTDANVLPVTTEYVSGKKSLKVTKSLAAQESSGFTQSLANLTPGGRYRLSGFIKAYMQTGGYGEAICRLNNWADDVYWMSDNIGITINPTNAMNNDNNWHYFTRDITLPLTPPGNGTVPGGSKGGKISQMNLDCFIYSYTLPVATSTAYFDGLQVTALDPVVLTTETFNETEVRVAWNDVFSEETGFKLFRCKDAGGTPCSDFSTTYKTLGANVSNYTDAGLEIGATYRYKVSAYKTATCPWEFFSNVAVASTNPTPPVLLNVTSQGSLKIKIDWKDTTSTETGFNIERCDGELCKTAPVFSEIVHNLPVAYPVNSALKAQYLFNGNKIDTSGNNVLLGKINSATETYQNGGLNLATNSNDNIRQGFFSEPTDILNTDEHSISFDFRYDGNSTYDPDTLFIYLAGGTNFNPKIDSKNARYFVVSYSPGFSANIGLTGKDGIPFADNIWYSFYLSKSNGKMTIYINGKQVVTDLAVPNSKVAGGAAAPFNISQYLGPNITVKNFRIYASGLPPDLLTYTDSTVCPDTYYKYRVVPYKASGWGQAVVSNELGATTPKVNPLRTPFTANVDGDTRIALAWVTNTENDLDNVVLKECLGTDCTTMNIPAGTSYTKSGLVPETQYCYEVAAYKSSPSCNSGAGMTSSFIAADKCPITYPARPSNLTAKALNAYKVQLDWLDEAGSEDNYEVQVKIFNDTWVTRAVLDKTTGTHNSYRFIDTIAIEPLKKYIYRIITNRSGIQTISEATVTYTPPEGGATINSTPAFTGGDDKATCICTTVDSKEVCK